MAKKAEKNRAIQMRKQGKSYSYIKQRLNVSKGTLSYWLREYPLSSERIKLLRDNNPQRIENFRNTMRKKREEKNKKAFLKVRKDIKSMSSRELFVSGFFLYWAEGTKVDSTATVSLSNSDLAILKFFIKWLDCLGVSKEKLRARLHIYSDMDEKKEIEYWSKALGISKQHFRKSYIKNTQLANVFYQKGGHAHGTCNISYGSSELCRYVLQGIEYLRERVE